mmetsp:Transcript_47907/g.94514  ORF Transcript_47907/g.94514 Transcript_47907/m.94514 type:complete len:475 (-) Transcript_47907:84-1508(-)
MNGGTCRLSSCQKSRNDLVLSVLVVQHLRLPVRGDPSHVVVDSGKHGDGLFGDIDACEDLCSLRDAGQTLVQSLGRQMREVQVAMILLGSAPSPLSDLDSHRTGHNVTRRKVLRCGGVPRHEGFSLCVLQNSSLPSAALCHQTTGREDPCGVELNELQILKRQARPCDHCTTVPCASVSGGAGLVRTPIAASCEDRSIGSEPVDGPVLHTHRDHPCARPVAVHDQIQSEVLNKEEAVMLQRSTVQSVEHRVPCSVCSSSASVSLTSLAKLQRLSSERPLVNLSILRSRKWQTVGLQLQHSSRGFSAHVLDRILITKPVRTLHGIIRVPGPVILSHIRKCSVDSSLCCHCMGSGGEQLTDTRGLQSLLDATHSSPEPCTPCPDNHGIELVINDRVPFCCKTTKRGNLGGDGGKQLPCGSAPVKGAPKHFEHRSKLARSREMEKQSFNKKSSDFSCVQRPCLQNFTQGPEDSSTHV